MTDREDEFEGRPGLVRARARTVAVQRLFVAVICVFLVASLSILVYNALVGMQTRAALLDCTTPDGSCYQKGQKQTGEAIQKLIDANALGDVATQRVVVLAAACSEEPEIKSQRVQTVRIKMLEDCVNAQLDIDKEGSRR